MNRTQALNYLTNTYAELATEANWTETTRLFAYSLVIDQALRGLDVPEDSLQMTEVEHTEDITGYYALLDYYALSRYVTAFATRADVSVSGAISASQSQIFTQVNQLLAKAEERLETLGLEPTEQITAGRYTLDFLEPDMEGIG